MALKKPAKGQFDHGLEGTIRQVADGLTTTAARLSVAAWYIHAELASRSDAFSTTGVQCGRCPECTRAVRLEADAVMLAPRRVLCAAPNAPPGRWTRYLSLNATVSVRWRAGRVQGWLG